MTAKEMFEEFGYKRNVEDEKITYLQKFGSGYFHIKITFNLSKKEIGINSNMDVEINDDILQVIIQQCKELDWIDEKNCTDFSSNQTSDFMCSNCGIYLDDLSQIVIDENCKRNVNQDEYELRYCPNCGCKIVDYEHFAKKQKYKVTQFEFDLLNTYRLCKEECKFRDCSQLRQLKVKGYFKDVDENVKIHDILWNCEVIK